MTTTTTKPSETEQESPSTVRHSEANNLVKNYVIASMGLGLVPVPLVDLVALMALQVKLVHGLAKHYDVSFKENVGKSLVISLLSGGSSIIGVLGLESLAKTLPVLGTLGGAAGVAITAGSITYAVGQVFAKHFESGGSLLDFDPKKTKEVFKQKLKEGQDVAKSLKDRVTSKEPPATSAPA
jgi:uncharacterized protein (DUF697 family)